MQLSAYSGKDDSSQEYERCLAGTLPCRNIPANRNRIQELQTRNNWLTNALALNILVPLKQNIFWQTHAGFSSFDMNFLKDDFLFSRELFTDSDDFVVRPLLIENALNETNLKQTLQFGFRNMTLTAGAQYFYYDVQYREDSFQRVSFISKETSHQADVFAQADLDISPVLEITAGSRFQYFSNGKTSRLSPRLSFKYQPGNTLSFHAGYSKNVQFINRISFSDAHSADIWLSGRNGEPPTEVQQL